jgi:hypothetical protein
MTTATATRSPESVKTQTVRIPLEQGVAVPLGNGLWSVTLSNTEVLEVLEALVGHNASNRVAQDNKASKDFAKGRNSRRAEKGLDALERHKDGKFILFGGKAKKNRGEGWSPSQLYERSVRINNLTKQFRSLSKALVS